MRVPNNLYYSWFGEAWKRCKTVDQQIILLSRYFNMTEQKLDTYFTNLTARFDVIESTFKDIQDEFATITLRVDAVETIVTGYESRIVTLEAQVDTLLSDVSTLMADVQTLGDQVVDLTDRVVALESEILNKLDIQQISANGTVTKYGHGDDATISSVRGDISMHLRGRNVGTDVYQEIATENGVDITRLHVTPTNVTIPERAIAYADLPPESVATVGDYQTALAAVQDTLQNNISGIATRVTTIENKIPVAASPANQLADKDFVNSSISSLSANPVASNAQGASFATYAALVAGPWFIGGVAATPSLNDYAKVDQDENNNNLPTRYVCGGLDGSGNPTWVFQFIVNDTAFTAAQLEAINSGITQTLTNQITLNTANLDNKVDKVTSSNPVSRLYGVSTTGAQVMVTIDETPTTQSTGVPRTSAIMQLINNAVAGSVVSVQGAMVDNTDPQNPVVGSDPGKLNKPNGDISQYLNGEGDPVNFPTGWSWDELSGGSLDLDLNKDGFFSRNITSLTTFTFLNVPNTPTADIYVLRVTGDAINKTFNPAYTINGGSNLHNGTNTIVFIKPPVGNIEGWII